MLHPNSNSAAYAFLYFLVAVCGWTLYITVYRLAFHPLAQIPGPRFAAASYLYQTCFCFVGGSRFYQQIERLHKKYGKINILGSKHERSNLLIVFVLCRTCSSNHT
jgi:hypothetical protein